MTKGLLTALTILATNLIFGQDCSCADNFVWLKETIENNDAGFQYAIDQKGEREYQKHSNFFSDKVKKITDKEECAEILLSWLRFFRNGHLWIGLNNDKVIAQVEIDTLKIKAQYADWKIYPYKKNEFNKYISKLNEPSFEGIWSSPPYTIGIKKVNNEYIGFIIEADGVYWDKNQVKFKIKEEADGFKASYFMKDHTAKEFTDVELLGNNHLQLGFVSLQRIQPKFPAVEPVDRYFRFLRTEVPIFEVLNQNTAILRFPSFSFSEKRKIDSIIEANWQRITNIENLIIDLRNNGGGSDESFG